MLRVLKNLVPERIRWCARIFLRPETVWPFDSFLVNHRYGFLYCPIQKVACTSLKFWLLETVERSCGGLKPGEIHPFMDAHYSLRGAAPGEVARVLGRYHRLAFVRNPWERVVSAYLDKFVTDAVNWQNRAVIESAYAARGHRVDASETITWRSMGQEFELAVDPSIDYARGVSFREFVDYLCRTPDAELDVHWRPQYLFFGGLRFHTVGKMERLSEQLREFEDTMGIERTRLSHSNQVRRSHGGGGKSLEDVPSGTLRELDHRPDAGELYTAELAGRIGRRYAEDIRRFGYECPVGEGGTTVEIVEDVER